MVLLSCYLNIWQMVLRYLRVGRRRVLNHMKTIQGNNPKVADIVASITDCL